jgi:hypothetical protein
MIILVAFLQAAINWSRLVILSNRWSLSPLTVSFQSFGRMTDCEEKPGKTIRAGDGEGTQQYSCMYDAIPHPSFWKERSLTYGYKQLTFGRNLTPTETERKSVRGSGNIIRCSVCFAEVDTKLSRRCRSSRIQHPNDGTEADHFCC